MVLAVAVSLMCAMPAVAQPVTVFVGGAMTTPVREVAAEFSKSRGTPVNIVSDTTGGLQKRLRSGEKADIVIVAAQGLDVLQGESLVLAENRINLARALIGVGIRAGSRAPDISSVTAFTQSLLAARSVSYVDPKAGGTSGTYFAGLLQTLGIAAAMAPKTVFRQQGSEVAAAVAEGVAEIGITFTSELSPNKGVLVAGVLPAEIQSPTIYAAAMTSSPGNSEGARALLQMLQTPLARAAIVKAGLEPTK
jgi:molybdate transport system substrate-binding protein